MFLRRYLSLAKTEPWSKVVTLSSSLFFVMLADAIISFWVPNLLQDALKSSVAMGFVVAFQSVVGFGADLVFPNLLKNATVRRLVMLAIFSSFLTLATIVGSTYWPYITVFLLAMALWGIYYEFMAFACNQFVADTIPLTARSGAWGIMSVFKNLAYFLGPLMAAYLIIKGNFVAAAISAGFLLLGLTIIGTFGRNNNRPLSFDLREVNMFREIEHWLVLIKHVWPVVVMTLVLGIIDATFWTTGAVWTVHLAKESVWGAMFLPLYSLPSLFMGFAVAKWGIFVGKKRLALKFLIGSGIFLLALGFSLKVPWQLLAVFISSMMLAIAYPLIEGVYSDISARLGKEKNHLIGLVSSVINLSYIGWPIAAGFMAREIGEGKTFASVGGLTILLAGILLILTPKKIKLPQSEIHEWKD